MTDVKRLSQNAKVPAMATQQVKDMTSPRKSTAVIPPVDSKPSGKQPRKPNPNEPRLGHDPKKDAAFLTSRQMKLNLHPRES